MILVAMILTVCLLILAIVLWNALAWPKIRAAGRVRPGAVSALIPARNEELNLADCLESVVRQDETVAEVLVYDDHSTDATPEIIRRYAERDKRVRLVAARELPPGWCGKNFACAQLARKRAATGCYSLTPTPG
ncbi:MAG TPA: glycosyltransferase [Blastocatellia bacterium]|nr:glycosyltransferase [Blastocatellia bacterium]